MKTAKVRAVFAFVLMAWTLAAMASTYVTYTPCNKKWAYGGEGCMYCYFKIQRPGTNYVQKVADWNEDPKVNPELAKVISEANAEMRIVTNKQIDANHKGFPSY